MHAWPMCHAETFVGFKRDDQGHAWSYFHAWVITCAYLGRWVHLARFQNNSKFKFPNFMHILKNDLKFGTRVRGQSHAK